MFFALPWMLLGLLGLPALAAIYWLRNRSKPRVVSSLFLWTDQRVPQQGGRVVERLQTPLTFFLELIALACIALAAAGPALTQSQFARPLIVVLDDSYSMQAGGDASSLKAGREKLEAEFRRTNYVARFILSGPKQQLLSNVVRTQDDLKEVLNEWTGTRPSAHLEAAISLASEIGGVSSRILVITDHPPETDIVNSKLQWWSTGKPLSNVAFTAASRDTIDLQSGLQDRVLLEMTNFSRKPVTVNLQLTQNPGTAPQSQQVDLEPSAVNRLILTLPENSGTLSASIDANDLPIDNNVVLVSPRKRPLRLQLSLSQSADQPRSLTAQLTRALEATGQVTFVDSRPDLIITDTEPPGSAVHSLQIFTGGDAVSYEGPFILNRSHPLAEGLSLEAVIWSAPKETTLKGTPVVTAGNRVLMTDLDEGAGRHHTQLMISSETSSVTDGADWPILITNLVRWCLSSVPGPSASNVRLGQAFSVTLTDEAMATGTATVTTPSGKDETVVLHEKVVDLQGDQVGLYQFKAGAMSFPVACNALGADESNLLDCVTGEFGNWNDSDSYQDQRMSVDWIFILIALVCLALEIALLAKRGVAGA